MVMIKNNGTLFQLNMVLGDCITLEVGKALTDIQKTFTWLFTSCNLNLTDVQVMLTSFVGEMPRDNTLPRYHFSTQWFKFILDRLSTVQVPPCLSGPASNLGQDVVMSSLITNKKTTTALSEQQHRVQCRQRQPQRWTRS